MLLIHVDEEDTECSASPCKIILVTARTCFQSGWRVILVGCGSIFIALGKEEFQKHFFVIIASFCFSCGSFFFFFFFFSNDSGHWTE